MEKIKINQDFIQNWSSPYDNIYIGGDEDDYELIKTKVNSDIVTSQSLSKNTFTDILNWKSARTKGKIDWNNFEVYQATIKSVSDVPDLEKIELLCSLNGIGIPIASTILHFIYPDTIPIMDFRVTEALNHLGYLKYKAISLPNYRRYTESINEIASQSKSSFRVVDRALFAYHKMGYEHSKESNSENEFVSNKKSSESTQINI